MTKGNGKDEDQPAGAQEPEPEQAQEGPPVQGPFVMGMIVVDRETGALRMQYNTNAVKDKVDFFLAVMQIALGEVQNERAKQRAGQILVPKRQIVRPPGL